MTLQQRVTDTTSRAPQMPATRPKEGKTLARPQPHTKRSFMVFMKARDELPYLWGILVSIVKTKNKEEIRIFIFPYKLSSVYLKLRKSFTDYINYQILTNLIPDLVVHALVTAHL